MKKNTRYLFVCGAISSEQHKYMDSICSISLKSAHEIFQWEVVKGFEENNISLDILSAPYLPVYPVYKDKIIKSFESRLTSDIFFKSISYKTQMLPKHYTIYKGLYKGILKWCENNEGYNRKIIVYNTIASYLYAAVRVKQELNDVELDVIIADMVDDILANSKSISKKIQYSIEKKIVYKSYDYIDKYILLSEKMTERLSIANKKYYVIEGFYSKSNSNKISEEHSKSILYSGFLVSYANIDNLLDAFELIMHKEYKLIICGYGPLEKLVEERAKNNRNIIFMGSIPHEEVIKLQHTVSFLINPRQPSEITKYSFPSKTMEYLASGTPTIIYKLQGIPDEYYKYCITAEGKSPQELAECIDNAIDMAPEYLIELGASAKKFIEENKNSKIQISKMLSFLK